MGVMPNLKIEEPDQSAVLRHDTKARFILAISVLVQFVLLVGYIIFAGRELPDSQLILGAEIGFVTTIISYFFGSSSGSVTKSAAKDAQHTQP